MEADIHTLKKKLEALQEEIRRQSMLTNSIMCKLQEGKSLGSWKPPRKGSNSLDDAKPDHDFMA